MPSPTATLAPIQTAPALRATATPAPTPQGLTKGGILRLSVIEAPPHLDPHQTVSPALHTWGPGLVYSRLFRYATGPGHGFPSGEVVCDLCESWVQTDPLTLYVKLRAEARWQAVSPVPDRNVTASDVALSLRRAATPGWANSPLMANIERVEEVDPTAVLIRFRQPDAEALETLADSHLKVVAEEAMVQPGGLLRGPAAGSGPWRLEQFDLDGASYSADRGYYLPGVPYLDGLDIRVINDVETRIAALRNRLLDLDQSAFDSASRAMEAFPDLVRVRMLEPGTGVSVALNASRPPLDSLEVRRAVLKALDPEEIAGTVWDGEGVVTTGLPVPSGSWLIEWHELRPSFDDPVASAQLLTALDPSGRRVRLTVGEFSDAYVAVAEAVARSFASAGLEAEVERVPTRVYAERAWFGGDYQVLLGAQPPANSLNAYLYAVYHSRGSANTTGVISQSLDPLIEQQATEPDPGRRRELVLQIQREVMQLAYRFNLVTKVTLWLHWPEVRGFAPNLFRGENYWLTDVWLAAR